MPKDLIPKLKNDDGYLRATEKIKKGDLEISRTITYVSKNLVDTILTHISKFFLGK